MEHNGVEVGPLETSGGPSDQPERRAAYPPPCGEG